MISKGKKKVRYVSGVVVVVWLILVLAEEIQFCL